MNYFLFQLIQSNYVFYKYSLLSTFFIKLILIDFEQARKDNLLYDLACYYMDLKNLNCFLKNKLRK